MCTGYGVCGCFSVVLCLIFGQPVLGREAAYSLGHLDCYPVPVISSVFELLQGVQILTQPKLRNVYYLIWIPEVDGWKATLNTPSGHYE